MLKPLELLAPARDKHCALAAINFGADAIYMGAPDFGARKNASNSLDDIKDVIIYAHKFFVKVYITINTILYNNELDNVKKLIEELYEIGADGIIVQDFSIFDMKLPPIPVFASTQCDNRSLEKVKFFEKIGLKRVILARELTLEQIKEIASKTDIEIETFVHGALCVSYSGQCYMSANLGSRSANRGECAQPCRKKYTLIDSEGKVYAKDKHLLSLKDFCALDVLDNLIEAGVSSFKIEGRLKDENYVKNIVAAYNIALKNHKRTSSGKVFYDFEPDVNKSFNRGFCVYFLKNDERRDIYNFDTPKSMGEKLGDVIYVSKYHIEINTDKKISPQDGLCYISNGALKGLLVNKSEGNKIYPNKMPNVKKGDIIYRNYDCEFDKILKNSKTKRQIGVFIEINSVGVFAKDEDNSSVKVLFDTKEKAQNNEKMKEAFISSFKKTGDSDFYIREIDVAQGELPFLKMSELNALRRRLLDELMRRRLDEYKNRQSGCTFDIRPAEFPLKNNDYRLNVNNKAARNFYKKCTVDVKEKSFESSSKKPKNAELMRTKHCLRRAFNMCTKNLKDKKELFLIDEKGKKFKLQFDCKNCEMIIKD